MWGDPQFLLPIVRGTARASAVLFAVGTLSFAFSQISGWRRIAYPLLALSHAIHYCVVFLYVRATQGPAFVSSGRFIGAMMFGALMYSLMLTLATAPASPLAELSRRRRIVEAVAVYLLGFVFFMAYIFRLHRAPVLAPALVVLEIAALAAFVRARHFTKPSARAAAH
jgi:hypothetical protein